MKRITSKDNPIYKQALKLQKRKYREERRSYLLEGVKPVMDWLHEGLEIERVFVRESDGHRADLELICKMDNAISLSDDLFNRLSETENSQGVVAEVKMSTCTREDVVRLCKGGKSLVIMDRLQDPGNIGTIIRTAEAAGIGAVAVMRGTADVYSSKASRAAAGSLMRMPIIQLSSEKEAADLAEEAGMKLIVTALEDSQDCFETDLRHSAIVIGNEGRGVSEEFIGLAHTRVKIPMMGEIESLNAAVAAGILMYCTLQER